MNSIRDQIIINNNKIQLINKEFADYVVSYYFSKKDVKEFIKCIFDWFAHGQEVEYALIGDFLRYGKRYEKMNYIKIEELLDRFINKKYELGDANSLFKLGIYIYYEYAEMKNYAIKLLEKANDMNNLDAKAALGICYLDGSNLNEINKVRGEKLLREVVVLDNIKAKEILGNMLIKGNIIKRNEIEGEKLLEEATLKGSNFAKYTLAVRTLFGYGIKADSDKGKKSLYELIEENDTKAMIALGEALIDGIGSSFNVDEGIKLLNNAIDLGNNRAKLYLACRFVLGEGVEQDCRKGIRMVEELAEKGETDAKLYLANY